jgi:Flp pilus assembly pilin Flp
VINVYLEYFRAQLGRVGIDIRSEKGANAVEYILIALLIALFIFGAFQALGIKIGDVASNITDSLDG